MKMPELALNLTIRSKLMLLTGFLMLVVLVSTVFV